MKITELSAKKQISKDNLPEIYKKLRLVKEDETVLEFIVTNWETNTNFVTSENGKQYPYEIEVQVKGYVPYENKRT